MSPAELASVAGRFTGGRNSQVHRGKSGNAEARAEESAAESEQ